MTSIGLAHAGFYTRTSKDWFNAAEEKPASRLVRSCLGPRSLVSLGPNYNASEPIEVPLVDNHGLGYYKTSPPSEVFLFCEPVLF